MIDLKAVFRENPKCLTNHSLFKSVLREKYPEEQRMANILPALQECGIAARIKFKPAIGCLEMQKLIEQIEREWGIAAVYAREAMLIWAAAFDVPVFTVGFQAPIPRTAAPVSAAPWGVQPPAPQWAAPSAPMGPWGVPPVAPQWTVPSVSTTPAAPGDSTQTGSVTYVEVSDKKYEVEKREDGYWLNRFVDFYEAEMTIPSMVDGKPIKGLGDGLFSNRRELKKVHISEGIEYIGKETFSGCSSLMSVTLPNTLESIGEGAFQRCSFLTVSLPPQVQVIDWEAFSECRLLQRVDLPEKLKVIGGYAFSSCISLSEIRIPDGVTDINACAFWKCGLTAAYIPPSVTQINEDAFDNNFSMTIYCAPGSAARDYAMNHNFKCVKWQF